MAAESICERCDTAFVGAGHRGGRYCTRRCGKAAYMAEVRAADPVAVRDKMREYRADPDNAERQRAWNRRAEGKRRAAARARGENATPWDPIKDNARGAVHRAVLRGRIQPESCLFCGCLDTQAHHHDYSKPLDVTWLCARHHGLVHRQVDERIGVA